jgi:hypothetical protein
MPRTATPTAEAETPQKRFMPTGAEQTRVASEHEIDRALATLVACGGSVTAAAEQLEMSDRTLRSWRTKHAVRYAELHDKVAPQIEDELVRAARSTALLAFDTTRLGVEKTREALEADKVKDPAAATRNIATTGAILTDKLLALTGRPTAITEHRNPDQLLKDLQAAGVLRLPQPKGDMPDPA